MNQVSRPLLGLLVAAVVFLGVWLVALKPSSSSTNATAPGVAGLRSAVDKAHKAVTTSDAASVARGGTVATSPTVTAAPSTGAATTAQATTAKPTHISPSTSHRLGVVDRALAHKQVLALLFYNPPAADDRAVKQELSFVPLHGGHVVKLAVPLSELARYPVVTSQVPVTVSPTLVLVDPDQQATTIVGFADRFEIAQRVSDALRVP